MRGSGSLEQLSDTVVAMERNQQDDEQKNLSTIRVLKNRRVGETGVADTLRYFPDTGRLLPAEQSADDFGFTPGVQDKGDF
jgi:twinkle protein